MQRITLYLRNFNGFDWFSMWR